MTVVVALSFVLLLTAAGLMFHVSRQAQEADRRVVHSMHVKQAVADLLISLISAESGQRGYLISSDSAFLAPYYDMRRTLQPQLDELRNLTADNPQQLARLEALTPVLLARLAAIERTLDFMAQGREEEATKIVMTQGRRLMKDVRARVHALDSIEGRLLLEHQQHAAKVRERFLVAVGAMLAACGALAVFALLSMRRNLAAISASRARLAGYNIELEARVRERTDEISRAAQLAERERTRAEALLTDVNHRVGNNLALVSSFLTMQQRAVKNPDAAKALGAARSRVQAIASAHRKLRLGTDFATVKANEVLGAVLDDIVAGLPPDELIKINYQVEPLEIHARDAVSLGVLTSELVMNAVKHAFLPGESGEINVVLASRGANAFLEVCDDGVGWHDKASQETGGLGARIIDMVAQQFGGRPQRNPGCQDAKRPGTQVRIELAKLQRVQQP